MFALALLLAALPPLEVFFANPQHASPKLSPDGQSIAWLAASDQGVRNVWVRVLPAGPPRMVTNDAQRGIVKYFWHPSGKSVLYFQDQQGDENFHLFETSLETGQTRNLTPHPGVRAEFLAVDPARAQVLLMMNRRRHFEIYRLDLQTASLELDTENPGEFVNWAVDTGFQVRAAIAYRRDGTQEVMVRDNAKASWRMLQRFTPEETLGKIAGFTSDGKALWLLSSVGANTARLVEVNIASGAAKVLVEDPTYDVTEVVTTSAGGLAAAGMLREKMEWRFLDLSLRRDFDHLRSALGDGEISLVSRDAADHRWVVSVSRAEQPARYFLFHRETRKSSPLFASRPQLDAYPLAPMQPVDFAARDGLRLHGYLTRPVEARGATPMVLVVHGGPWVRDSYGYSGVVQFLASRGYAILQVNYRGSSGYGKAFLNAGNREWGAKMLDDLVDAKRWAVRQGYADPKRTAIMGASFGGYLTLAALAFAPEEFACGVDIVGQSNLLTFLGRIPPSAAAVLSLYDQRVGNLQRDQDMLRARSPYFHADRIVRPLLVGQGANDPRVPPAESEQIVDALRAQNKPVTYIVFPDEGHGFVKPGNILRFMAEVEQFLASHLAGAAK